MIRRRLFAACACLLPAGFAATRMARAQHPVFGYSGANGPSQWGGMSEHWGACSAGRNQSPVDLAGRIEAELPPLGFSYTTDGQELINNGHTLQVNVKPGSTLAVDGVTFKLVQFHFHAPSEHHLDGQDFPLEAHLVHQDAQGALAVVGVLFAEGAANPLVGRLWGSMPAAAGQRRTLSTGHAPAGLLPANRDYFRYNGSLTTPPCSEGVRWLIMKQPMTVSRAQIEAFEHALGFANNRPVQPVNARPLLQ